MPRRRGLAATGIAAGSLALQAATAGGLSSPSRGHQCEEGFYQHAAVALGCAGGSGSAPIRLTRSGHAAAAFSWVAPAGTSDLEVEVVLQPAKRGSSGGYALEAACEGARPGQALVGVAGTLLNDKRRSASLGGALWEWSGDPGGPASHAPTGWLRVNGTARCDVEITLTNSHASTLVGNMSYSWARVHPCPRTVRGCAPCPASMCHHDEVAWCDGSPYWECRVPDPPTAAPGAGGGGSHPLRGSLTAGGRGTAAPRSPSTAAPRARDQSASTSTKAVDSTTTALAPSTSRTTRTSTTPGQTSTTTSGDPPAGAGAGVAQASAGGAVPADGDALAAALEPAAGGSGLESVATQAPGGEARRQFDRLDAWRISQGPRSAAMPADLPAWRGTVSPLLVAGALASGLLSMALLYTFVQARRLARQEEDLELRTSDNGEEESSEWYFSARQMMSEPSERSPKQGFYAPISTSSLSPHRGRAGNAPTAQQL